jgi:hypothetical protein
MDLRPLDDAEDYISSQPFAGSIFFNEGVDLDEVVTLTLVALDQALTNTSDLMEIKLALLREPCPLVDLLKVNTGEAYKTRLKVKGELCHLNDEPQSPINLLAEDRSAHLQCLPESL